MLAGLVIAFVCSLKLFPEISLTIPWVGIFIYIVMWIADRRNQDPLGVSGVLGNKLEEKMGLKNKFRFFSSNST